MNPNLGLDLVWYDADKGFLYEVGEKVKGNNTNFRTQPARLICSLVFGYFLLSFSIRWASIRFFVKMATSFTKKQRVLKSKRSTRQVYKWHLYSCLKSADLKTTNLKDAEIV